MFALCFPIWAPYKQVKYFEFSFDFAEKFKLLTMYCTVFMCEHIHHVHGLIDFKYKGGGAVSQQICLQAVIITKESEFSIFMIEYLGEARNAVVQYNYNVLYMFL